MTASIRTYPKTPTATAASRNARPCSISRSVSGRIVAVLRGCRSFCTAVIGKQMQLTYISKSHSTTPHHTTKQQEPLKAGLRLMSNGKMRKCHSDKIAWRLTKFQQVVLQARAFSAILSHCPTQHGKLVLWSRATHAYKLFSHLFMQFYHTLNGWIRIVSRLNPPNRQLLPFCICLA